MVAGELDMQYHVRPMIAGDVEALTEAFASWNKPQDQYARYFAEHLRGERVTLVATVAGEIAGYGNLVWQSDYPPFRLQGIPEINDLNVLQPYRRRGIASAIIASCERIAAGQGRSVIGIGVGMTPDYANAQRLYPRLGYRPDGRGPIATPWGEVCYLVKSLR